MSERSGEGRSGGSFGGVSVGRGGRNTTYKPDSPTNRNILEMNYDALLGTWTSSSYVGDTSDLNHETLRAEMSHIKSKGAIPLPSVTESKVESKAVADKEFIEVEFNTLVGELKLIPNKRTIHIKVGQTINLHGVGKYLSGQYFVSAIRRALDKDTGYSHSITVIKTGFGDSLKQATQPVVESIVDRPIEVAKEIAPYKVGDSVQIVGDNATYSNADEGVKVPNWVKAKTLTIKQISKDGTRVLLDPIYSWTYTSNIQKV